MTSDLDDILDDLFHGCAFAAFVELAVERGGLPCPEATRLRAYRYYEEELARKGEPRFREPRDAGTPRLPVRDAAAG